MKTSFHFFVFFSCLDILELTLCEVCLLEPSRSSGHSANSSFKHALRERPLNLVRNLAVQVWVIDGERAYV